MLLFKGWSSIEIEVTCKNLGPNLNKFASFQNQKISADLEKNYFLAKTIAIPSILDIFWSSFLQTISF